MAWLLDPTRCKKLSEQLATPVSIDLPDHLGRSALSHAASASAGGAVRKRRRLGGAAARDPGLLRLRYALGTSRRAAQGPMGGCDAAVRPGRSRRICDVGHSGARRTAPRRLGRRHATGRRGRVRRIRAQVFSRRPEARGQLEHAPGIASPSMRRHYEQDIQLKELKAPHQ